MIPHHPDPDIIDGLEEFEVENILNVKPTPRGNRCPFPIRCRVYGLIYISITITWTKTHPQFLQPIPFAPLSMPYDLISLSFFPAFPEFFVLRVHAAYQRLSVYPVLLAVRVLYSTMSHCVNS